MPILVHYDRCDCCSGEERVRSPRSLPAGWSRITEPGGTPLRLCGGCTAALGALLRQLGWKGAVRDAS